MHTGYEALHSIMYEISAQGTFPVHEHLREIYSVLTKQLYKAYCMKLNTEINLIMERFIH